MNNVNSIYNIEVLNILIFLYFTIYFSEGEFEAEWLIAAGFPQLTKPFEQV